METLNQGWKNIALRKRTLISIIAVIMVVGAFALVWWLYQPKYGVLFANLEQTDAAEITQRLKAMEVPFSLENGGTTIKVDEKTLNETRLGLASEQLALTKPVGFEIFDDADFGLTEFAQKVNYQRALEGELARTITANKLYKQARVHLSIPEKRSFQREELKTKAAVTVVTVDQSRLNFQQVAGIQRLVSSAVPELDKDNVTVLDGVGRSYDFSDPELDVTGSGNMRLAYQEKVESYLVRKIEQVLDPVFGKDSFQIGVNTTLDFNKIRSKKQELTTIGNDDAGYVKRRIERRDETNEPKIKDVKNLSVEEEFEFGKEMIETETAAGQLSRLTVAVVINGTVAKQDIESVHELIAATVGIDPNRGDLLTVKAIPSYRKLSGGNEATIVQSTETIEQTEIVKNIAKSETDALQIKDMVSAFFKPNYVILALGTIFVVIVLIAAKVKSQLGSPKKLSNKEREELLQDVQDWLKIENMTKETVS